MNHLTDITWNKSLQRVDPLYNNCKFVTVTLTWKNTLNYLRKNKIVPFNNIHGELFFNCFFVLWKLKSYILYQLIHQWCQCIFILCTNKTFETFGTLPINYNYQVISLRPDNKLKACLPRLNHRRPQDRRVVQLPDRSSGGPARRIRMGLIWILRRTSEER